MNIALSPISSWQRHFITNTGHDHPSKRMFLTIFFRCQLLLWVQNLNVCTNTNPLQKFRINSHVWFNACKVMWSQMKSCDHIEDSHVKAFYMESHVKFKIWKAFTWIHMWIDLTRVHMWSFTCEIISHLITCEICHMKAGFHFDLRVKCHMQMDFTRVHMWNWKFTCEIEISHLNYGISCVKSNNSYVKFICKIQSHMNFPIHMNFPCVKTNHIWNLYVKRYHIWNS